MPDFVVREISVAGDGISEAVTDAGTVTRRSRSGRGSAGPQVGPAQLRVRALQLLTRRDYSRAILRGKLAAYAESEAQLDSVLDTLQAERLLSDQRYATQRAVARGSRYGNARLRQELKQQGVAEDDIAEALPEAGDEFARCRQVWGRKFGELPTSGEERAKQTRFLLYRGFSNDAIRRVLRGDDE